MQCRRCRSPCPGDSQKAGPSIGSGIYPDYQTPAHAHSYDLLRTHVRRHPGRCREVDQTDLAPFPLCPLQQQLTVRCKLQHPVVSVPVAYIKRTITRDSNVSRAVEVRTIITCDTTLTEG